MISYQSLLLSTIVLNDYDHFETSGVSVYKAPWSRNIEK